MSFTGRFYEAATGRSLGEVRVWDEEHDNNHFHWTMDLEWSPTGETVAIFQSGANNTWAIWDMLLRKSLTWFAAARRPSCADRASGLAAKSQAEGRRDKRSPQGIRAAANYYQPSLAPQLQRISHEPFRLHNSSGRASAMTTVEAIFENGVFKPVAPV